MSDILQQVSGPERSYWLLAVFIIGVFGIGTAVGIGFTPGVWYAGLAKPSFNPPDWLFGPVWSVLYVMIAVAGWRSFSAEAFGPQSLLWLAQMVLNFAWSPVMFGLQMLWPAFVVLSLMWLAIVAFIIVAWANGDRVSAALFMPYLAWVSFAGLLNITLAQMNPAA
ncbi:MAG: tryptophan-rich sensory protein [Phyllobacteriaceae bacterium]|nr:tryptophan-rich sensory protein [Phyllobacteriaceae bacterium]